MQYSFVIIQFTVVCQQLIVEINKPYSGYPRSKLACK